MIHRRFFLTSVILLFAGSVISQTRAFQLEDVNRLVGISGVQLSPDGKSVLYTTSTRNLEENRYDRTTWLMDIKTNTSKEFAVDLSGASSFQWSPNGREVAMTVRADNGSQIYIMDISSGETKQVTSSPTGIRRYIWSPDGNSFAFIANEERPKLSDNSHNNALRLGNNDYLLSRAPAPASVWIISKSGGEAKKVLPEGMTVGTGLSLSSLAWSPDGSLIACTVYPSPYSGDSDLGRNYLLELATGKATPATSHGKLETSPRFTADGKGLLFSYPRDGVPANQRELHVLDLSSKSVTNISKSLDRTVYGSLPVKDGMVITGVDDHQSGLWLLKGSKFTKIDKGEHDNISSLSMNKDGNMAFVGSAAGLAPELYFRSSVKSKPVKLTNANEFVNQLTLGKREAITWESNDDLRPNGIVTYPPNFEDSKKYPLVLLVHGGPTSSSGVGWNQVAQAMASKGWIVFQPNYRGSNNLGNAFQSAIANDPSEGPGHDVIAGVQELKKRPYIDSNKIAVSGWSYGGWMTSWLIGRYPEEWAAAVAGAAPVDFTDMYSLSDLNRMRRHSITDSPYKGENLQWAIDNSPLSNLSKIKAPTLIMSKTGDYRVSITGSYKLYGALRDNNIPVDFIGYPGPGHFPGDPVRYMDVYTRWIGWLEKYIGSTVEIEGLSR